MSLACKCEHLESQQQLLDFLDAPLYRTSTGSSYYEGKLGSDMDAMKQAAGIPKEYGSITQALRHKGMQDSQLLLNEMDKARRQLDHSGGVHDDYYAFCNYPNIKDSAAMAGHLDGRVRLYRTGLWASKIPKYKPLYDAINWISDRLLQWLRCWQAQGAGKAPRCFWMQIACCLTSCCKTLWPPCE